MTQIIDAIQYMDAKLRSKPRLEYTRRASRRYEVCFQPPCPPGADGLCPPICHWETEHYDERYSDVAQVTSSEIVSVGDLVFLSEQVTQLPENAILQRQVYRNCDDVNSSLTISMSVSGTEGYSLGFSKNVTTTSTASVNAQYGGEFGSLGTSLSFNRSVQIGRSETLQESQTVSRSVSVTVQIPPKTTGVASLLAYETEIEIPFTATVVLDGALKANNSGLNRASQLLSDEERTLEIEGILTIKNVSEGVFKTETIGGACTGEVEERLGFNEITEFRVPVESLEEQSAIGFEKLNSISSVDQQARLLRFPPSPESDGPVIGPIANGVSYEIIYSRPFVRPDVRCGYNDIGVPNLGTFNAEGRQYYHHVNGQLVRTWTAEEERWIGCYNP